MIPGAVKDASLARRELQHVADTVPGQSRGRTCAGRMDGIFEIMALFEHFLEPGRRIGCEEQALLVAAPKVDIVKQREPAEAKIAHGGIDRAMQIAKGFSTLTVRRKAREIIKAAAVFYPVRHRRWKLVDRKSVGEGKRVRVRVDLGG